MNRDVPLRRASRLITAAVAVLALAAAGTCSAAAAAVASGPVLDPAFGVGGSVRLAPEILGTSAFGVASGNSGLVVSGGSTLVEVSESGGEFKTFGTADGLLPPSPAEFLPAAVTADPEGRLLVLGSSVSPAQKGVPSTSSGVPVVRPSRIRLLRFLQDGRLDATFGEDGVVETNLGLPRPRGASGRVIQSSASVEATGIAVDPQGRIVVTGDATTRIGASCQHDIFDPVGYSVPFVTRLTSGGEIDQKFGQRGVAGGRSSRESALHAEKIAEPVIGRGESTTYRSTEVSECPRARGRMGIAAVTSKGRIRGGFGDRGVVPGDFAALASEKDGSIVVLQGIGRRRGGSFEALVTRLGVDGRVDQTFGKGGHTVVKLGSAEADDVDSLVIDPAGRILLGGTFANRSGRFIMLVRLSADGVQESGFGPHGRILTRVAGLLKGGPGDLFFDPDGRLLVLRRYTPGEHSGVLIARYLLSS